MSIEAILGALAESKDVLCRGPPGFDGLSVPIGERWSQGIFLEATCRFLYSQGFCLAHVDIWNEEEIANAPECIYEPRRRETLALMHKVESEKPYSD